MSNPIDYIVSTPVTPSYIRGQLAMTDMGKIRREHSQNFSLLEEIQELNKSFIERNKDILREIDDYTLVSVGRVFLELACFLGSIDKSFNDYIGKKVLVVGSNYGIEVIILRAFGMDAYGVESDNKAFMLSSNLLDMAAKSGVLPAQPDKHIFFEDDALNYMDIAEGNYDLILARNLNPLADVPKLLVKVRNVMGEHAVSLIQWDGLYHEELAISLYAPKKGIYYNENLRELFDALYKYVFMTRKTRARFLYKVL